MAFDYHGFVAELGLVAAAEADRSNRPLSDDFWDLLGRMLNVAAASVDVKLGAPRYGDGDNGMALVLDPDTTDRWPRLLAIGEALFDPPSWWPAVESDRHQHPSGIDGRSPPDGSAAGKPAKSLQRRRPDSAAKLFL